MNTYLLLMPSGYEVVVILLVIVLLFGGKKIPELMRGLGKGMNEFKKASSGLDDIKKEIGQSATDLNKTTPTENNEKKNDEKQHPNENINKKI